MDNPLMKYFRQPGMHVKLPSNGKYNRPSMIDFATGHEVAIYPLTAADEIIVSNPDSLLNGVALERIILSCCPAVQDAKDILVVDADVIILASKLVSYGDSLNLIANCPKCDTGTQFTLSIKYLIEAVKPLPNQHSVRLNDDLVAFLRPYTLEANNRINLMQFEQTKLIQNLMTQDISEASKASIISVAFEKIMNLTLELLSQCVIKIATPEDNITSQEMIKEYIDNAGRDSIKLIRDGLQEFSKYGLPRETDVVCDNVECKHEWVIPIVYDPSSFFALDS